VRAADDDQTNKVSSWLASMDMNLVTPAIAAASSMCTLTSREQLKGEDGRDPVQSMCTCIQWR
jgi:hypothetical protein